MVAWFVFAFLTAVLEAGKDLFSKKGMEHVDEYIAAWSLHFFATPLIILMLFFIQMPHLNSAFWYALAFSGSINIFSTVLYMKALKKSDISISVPLLTFTPLFLLVTSPIIVGEFPGALGLVGILLIFLGSYSMKISERHKGLLAPFRALLKEPGPKYMLVVAFLWSISSNFDKIGVQNSSALFWVVALNIFLVATLTPIMLYNSKGSGKVIKTHIRALVPIGMVCALRSMCQMTAISMALVAYVISIKRSSAVISVLFGYFFFKESGIKERLFGAALMVLGVILITLT